MNMKLDVKAIKHVGEGVYDFVVDTTDHAMEKMGDISIFDLAMMKICLVCFGITLATMFTDFFKKLSPAIKILFVVSYVYLIWKFFFEDDED